MTTLPARRSLADLIAQRKAEHERQQRTHSRARRSNRYQRWHVPDTPEREPENWLMTYLDLITLLLALLVVMLAFTRLNDDGLSMQPAAERAEPALAAGLRLDSLPAAPLLALPEDMPQIPASWAWADAGQADAPPPGAAGMNAADAVPAPTPAVADATASMAVDGPAIIAATAGIVSPSGPSEPDMAVEATLTSVAASTPEAPVPTAPPPTAEELGLTELGDAVDVIINSQSVSFRISNELLFPSGQALLSPSGLEIIRKLAQVINRSPHPVSVEGHSDPVPIQTRQFPSNWELSSGRAAAVLRELVRDGVAAERLRAVGYADTRPLLGNDSAQGRAANRRVELIMRIAADAASPDAGN